VEKENDYQTQVINLNTSTNTKHSNCRVHRPIYLTKLIFKLLLQNLFVRLLEYRLPIPEAEFKEFEPRFKFKPPLKYGWFHLNLYQMFQDLSRRSI